MRPRGVSQFEYQNIRAPCNQMGHIMSYHSSPGRVWSDCSRDAFWKHYNEITRNGERHDLWCLRESKLMNQLILLKSFLLHFENLFS